MSQTSVKDTQDTVPFPGVHNPMAPTKVATKISSESSDEIPFGSLVLHDGDDAKTGATGTPCGIVLHSHDIAKDNDLGDSGVKPGAVMNVLEEGEVYVLLSENGIAPGDAVRFVHTADTNQPRGSWRKGANAANSTLVDSDHAKWVKGGDAGDIGILWINMLGATVTADT